jgi:hypothetical protein
MLEPVVRARHLKTTLAAADRLPEAGAIRAAFPAGAAAEVAASSGFDWLPIGHDLALVRAIHGALGPAGHDAFSRGVIRESFGGPLLRAIVAAAQRTFPGALVAWVHWIPKAWALVFRGCGAWEVELVAPRAVDLRLVALPAAVFADPVWPGSVASSLSAVLDLAGASGTVRLVGLDEGRSAARYEMRWGPPDGR